MTRWPSRVGFSLPGFGLSLPPVGLPLPITVACLCTLSALSACGSAHRRSNRTTQLPSAAEPAAAPTNTLRPAGRVLFTGGMPEGIVADPRSHLVAVGLREPPVLALIDSMNGRLVRRVPIPGAPRHLQLAGPGGPVLVPAESANELLQVSLPGGLVTSTPTLRQPHDATALAGRIFVGNEFGGSVSVIARRRVVGSIGGLLQPGGVAADGAKLAVIDVRSDLLSLYDAHTLKPLGRARAGQGPTHVVAGPSGRLYVADTRGNAIEVFTTAAGLRHLATLTLPGTPYGLAIDSARRRLWVTLTARNELVELALVTNGLRPLARFSTARQPDTVAVDPSNGRVFVADRTAGVIQMIRPPAGG